MSGISILGDLIFGTAFILHHRLYTIQVGFSASNKLDALML